MAMIVKMNYKRPKTLRSMWRNFVDNNDFWIYPLLWIGSIVLMFVIIIVTISICEHDVTQKEETNPVKYEVIVYKRTGIIDTLKITANDTLIVDDVFRANVITLKDIGKNVFGITVHNKIAFENVDSIKATKIE